MQVIYVLGLFGFIFSVVMGLTSNLTRSAMQNKLNEVAHTREMFEDIEKAVNDGVMANYADLKQISHTFRNGTGGDLNTPALGGTRRDFLYGRNGHPGILEFVSWPPPLSGSGGWTSARRLQDPWGSNLRIYFYTQYTLVDTGVSAPETAFAIISPGPNRTFETSIGAVNFNNVKSADAPNGSDDIVFVFTTRPALIRTWNTATKALDNLVKAVEANYTDQYVRFMPNIKTYNEAMFSSGSFGFDNASLNAWESALSGQPNFPRMPTTMSASLGARDIFEKVPLYGEQSLLNHLYFQGFAGLSSRTRLRLQVNTGGYGNNFTGWRVNHTRLIDGRILISN